MTGSLSFDRDFIHCIDRGLADQLRDWFDWNRNFEDLRNVKSPIYQLLVQLEIPVRITFYGWRVLQLTAVYTGK